MPTRKRKDAAAARAAAATGETQPLVGLLKNNKITPDVLDRFPLLLDKAQPDPDKARTIEGQFNVGPVTYYKVKLADDSPYCRATSLTEIRAQYVALPT